MHLLCKCSQLITKRSDEKIVIELLEDVRKSINKSELLRTQAITSLGNTNLRSLLIKSQKEPTQKCNTRYQRLSDPVKAWLDDRCVLGMQYETDKQKAHSDFINYCWNKRLNRLENKCTR